MEEAEEERERERQGKRKWESEHYVNIVHCSPTPSRPLEGFWKGISEDMNLNFFLVVYDDIGSIACEKVGDSAKSFPSFPPVFWTSNPAFTESPLSPEEAFMYDTWEHLCPPSLFVSPMTDQVSRIIYIISSYDVVFPWLLGSTMNCCQTEGRIWQYVDGTFGFGFLENSYILDVKPIALNGSLLDAAHK